MAGYASLWVDQSPSMKPAHNDATPFILNVAFTCDLELRERGLRKTWGASTNRRTRSRRRPLLTGGGGTQLLFR
jgi:hypothetical protein